MATPTEVPVIAIDGPSGTGKGTVGKCLAEHFGWHYLDSGAIYRVFALSAHDRGISPQDTGNLRVLADTIEIRFAAGAIICDGRDVSDAIRTEHCGELASRYAGVGEVRDVLLDLQRAQRIAPGLVADGRDMGTRVFPDAEVKVFLDASPEVRAERRYKQLMAKGFDVNLARLCEEMAERDARDASRAASPMKMAADATRIDTSAMSIEDVVDALAELVTARTGDTRTTSQD